MKTKVFALMGGFTSLMQVFALCTPWWVIVKRDERRTVYGLWYTLSCEVSQGVSFCKTLYHHEPHEEHDVIDVVSNFLEYEIETMVAACVCLAATALGTVYRHRRASKDYLGYGLGGSLLLVASGSTAWVAIGKLIKENVDLGGHETIDIPWSLIISALSSTVPFVLGAFTVPFLLTNFRQLKRDRVAARALEDKIQSSTANLYTTDISMDRLPGYHNMGTSLTPAPSFSTLDSTAFPGDSVMSEPIKSGEIFL
ncbi:uncharacterized protein LOC110443293 [Mizuhopecten yessoensis]|uniref:Uncharacterized protein n=1 Tax=Mizuhopecten yessoensis TaxID=6573 RepID=A0A210PFB8_MIZYE|nr:uncharacterized protein LOC110443293 [Mizuhopecten yessoensis]OWF35151.1 hypothetical protein KP79_PYT05414 [Mizuhopecten yessoensis]